MAFVLLIVEREQNKQQTNKYIYICIQELCLWEGVYIWLLIDKGYVTTMKVSYRNLTYSLYSPSSGCFWCPPHMLILLRCLIQIPVLSVSPESLHFHLSTWPFSHCLSHSPFRHVWWTLTQSITSDAIISMLEPMLSSSMHSQHPVISSMLIFALGQFGDSLRELVRLVMSHCWTWVLTLPLRIHMCVSTLYCSFDQLIATILATIPLNSSFSVALDSSIVQ